MTMPDGPIEGQHTRDHELLQIRLGWQNGLTMEETYDRMKKRFGYDNQDKLVAEWEKMERIFGCGSLRLDYCNGWKYRPFTGPSQAEIDTVTGINMVGAQTYGDWKGITGPGKRLREILAKERDNDVDKE